MKSSAIVRVPAHKGLRHLRVLATSALLSVCLSGAALADTSKMDAKLAVARAQASIELVSKENPAATRDQSFTDAQKKLADATVALDDNKNQQALWLAHEAELMATTTAGAAKLAGLVQTRTEIARNIDILETELRSK